jgi:hypothetical protein
MTYHAMWTDAEWAAARGITIRQPWAWAVAEADEHPEVAKGVENRGAGFPGNYRGPLLIHSGKAWSPRGGADERVKSLWVQGSTEGVVGDLDPDHPAFIVGHVLAVAELADTHPATDCCLRWGEMAYVASDGHLRTGVLHLLLENVVRLPTPIPHKGALGLWRPTPQALELIGAQVGRAA